MNFNLYNTLVINFKTHAEPNDSYSVAQGELFYSLIKLNQLKTVVEIGVDMGSTTRYLCEATKYTGGTVYGYDNWGDYGPANSWHHCSSKEEIERLLERNNFNNFKLFKVDTFSQEFKELIQSHKEIDFAFIDGDHSYDGIKSDFELVYPKLSYCGIIAFHDTLIVDGCREFILDLRSKYNDGTFDIVDFPFGNLARRVGISLLVKRNFIQSGIKIDAICGSNLTVDQIYEKERQWYQFEVDKHKYS